MKLLRYFLVVVDGAFLLHWAVTALHLIPDRYLYNNYLSPILEALSWSFFPWTWPFPSPGWAPCTVPKGKRSLAYVGADFARVDQRVGFAGDFVLGNLQDYDPV